MKTVRIFQLLTTRLVSTFAIAQDLGNLAGVASTFQDPAVPMIQLPMDFKSQRVYTQIDLKKGEFVDIMNVKGPGAVRSIWQLFADHMEIEVTVDGTVQPQARVPAKATPTAPPSGTSQWLTQESPAQSKFLATGRRVPPRRGAIAGLEVMISGNYEFGNLDVVVVGCP